MKANKKKIIVLVSMILLLVATGVLNYFLSANAAKGKGGDSPDGGVVEPTFFQSYRLTRESTREREIAYLNEIIASEHTTAEGVASAEADRIKLTKAMEQELVIESLIKAKGFGDAIVTLSTENANVVVKTAELTDEQVAQILDIVVSESEFTAPNVVINPY